MKLRSPTLAAFVRQLKPWAPYRLALYSRAVYPYTELTTLATNLSTHCLFHAMRRDLP